MFQQYTWYNGTI